MIDYCQTSNIRRSLLDNNVVDLSDVVWAATAAQHECSRPLQGRLRPAPRVLCRCGSTNHDSADRIIVGHRMRVTAVTRLLRWRQRKTRLQVRPHFTMLQGMDRCDFWHVNMCWIGLTCGTGMSGHRSSG